MTFFISNKWYLNDGDMMKIYLDVVIGVNYIFDLILLFSVNYILRRNASLKRMLLGALIGSITLIILFLRLNMLCLMIYKFIVAILMLIVSFGYKDFNYLKKNIIYFYLVSMLMGGGIYFLNSQFSYTNNGLLFNGNDLKVSYGIIVILAIGLFFKYMLSFKELKNNYSNYYKCKIYFDDNNYVLVNAYLDTGNKLKDPYSDKSIILLDKNKVKDMKMNKPIYVPYNSLNNHGLLTCFKALKLEIDGQVCDKFLIGISERKFFMDGIDCIINSNVMEGLR